jgi:oxaloacetate decarboxylase (Na+ extruding) subunit gamma
MLLKGVFLMFIGMGIVFLFLEIMVIAVGLQARVVRKFFPEKEEEQPATPARTGVTPEVAAAIAVGLQKAGKAIKA